MNDIVSNKKWGFGLIGCGIISEFHMDAIRDIPNATLVAVSDRNEPKAMKAAARNGARWTTDHKQLLADPDIDIVCVTTSSGSHFPLGMDVLLAGKHLIVEKPIAMTVEDALCLLRLSRERQLLLSVISQRRFERQHLAVKQALSGQATGRLLLAEVKCPYFRAQDYYDSAAWRGTHAHDGGALMNQAIHSIDLLLWLTGPVRSVMARTATQAHRMEAEDIGLAVLELENGAFGTVMVSTSIVPGFTPELNIFGEKGSVKLEGTNIVHWSVPGVAKPDLDELTSGGGVADPRNISNRYHRMQIADCLAALERGHAPAVTGIDGAKAVQLIGAIQTSANERREVTLEPIS